MMLEQLGEQKPAELLEKAVIEVTGKHLRSLAAGKMGYGTTEVGDLVVKFVNELSLD
jgi:3-isopropylmalate dehydrogenase